jgi:ABC-type phosphate transport system substrate-binding protein
MMRAAAVLLAFAFFGGDVTTAANLRVGGTGGAIEMMRHVGAGFTAASGTNVDIAMSLGSNGALRALADGVLDVAVTARVPAPDEGAADFAVVPIARTPLIFATSHRAPDGLKSTELANIFSLDKPLWSDGSPIRIILRTRLDADTMLIADLFPGMREAFARARLRTDLPVAATDQDNTRMAEAIPGSLIGAGLSQLEMEKRNLHYVAVDGAMPSLAALESKAYPYEKVFYLVFPLQRSTAAQFFLDFIRTKAGREMLRESGNLPVEK